MHCWSGVQWSSVDFIPEPDLKFFSTVLLNWSFAVLYYYLSDKTFSNIPVTVDSLITWDQLNCHQIERYFWFPFWGVSLVLLVLSNKSIDLSLLERLRLSPKCLSPRHWPTSWVRPTPAEFNALCMLSDTSHNNCLTFVYIYVLKTVEPRGHSSGLLWLWRQRRPNDRCHRIQYLALVWKIW